MQTDLRAYVAEAFGTACLVLFGCASVTVANFGADTPMGILPIALVFGFCLTFLIYAIGPISGCHVNPAITLGLWASNRFAAAKVPGYILSQLAGGVVGAGLLLLILQGQPNGYDAAGLGLGQNGWGTGYLGQYDLTAALITEVLATGVFMVVIIGATANAANWSIAGLTIGFCLFALIACFANVTGVSVNPARSLGPAVFVGGHALSQVWLFFLAPIAGALVGGLLLRKR